MPTHLLARRRASAAGTVALQPHWGLAPSVPGCGHSMLHRAMHAPAAVRSARDEMAVEHAPRLLVEDLAPQRKMARKFAAQTACAAVVASQPADSKSVSLSSKAGRSMFTEALAADSLHAYFSLSEQMVFQPDESMRPVTCLSVVLNALGHDPHKTWRPIWRWNTEEVLLGKEVGARSVTAASIHRQGGLQLHELAELARNNGARAQAFPACPSMPNDTLSLLSRPNGKDAFRSRVKAVCSGAEEHLVVHMLAPGGQWKYAPVAGYHADSDRLLLLDLDRAAAPRWVTLKGLWGSMCESAGGKTGGFVAVGSMVSAPAALSAPDVAGCPRVVRSWGSGKLVVEPVLEVPVADLSESVLGILGGQPCPLSMWAEARRTKGIVRHSQHRSRNAMRLGSPSMVKSRSRSANIPYEATVYNTRWRVFARSGSNGKADASNDEAIALAALLLQSWPLAGPQSLTIGAAGRGVHSMRTNALAHGAVQMPV